MCRSRKCFLREWVHWTFNTAKGVRGIFLVMWPCKKKFEFSGGGGRWTPLPLDPHMQVYYLTCRMLEMKSVEH